MRDSAANMEMQIRDVIMKQMAQMQVPWLFAAVNDAACNIQLDLDPPREPNKYPLNSTKPTI